jgi:hypothetical protein
MPSLVIVSFYGPAAAGWVAPVKSVMEIPLRLIGTAVSQAYLGHGAEIAQRSRAEVGILQAKIMINAMVLGVIDIHFYWNIIRFVLVVGSLVLLGLLGADATDAVAAFGFATAASYATLLLVLRRVAGRHDSR